MDEKFFTSTETAKITGCTARQLQHWRLKGVVVPTVNTAGTGRNVYYTVSDLLKLTVMQYFLSLGLSFELSQETLNKFRDIEPEFFREPFEYKKMRRFMLSQESYGKQLDFIDFDEQKAIAALRQGQAVIPFWTGLVGKQLALVLQSFGSRLETFAEYKVEEQKNAPLPRQSVVEKEMQIVHSNQIKIRH